MKNKADKAIPLELIPLGRLNVQPNMVKAKVKYDVKKLNRISHGALIEILFHKTVKLYPFAVVDTDIEYVEKPRKVAYIQVWLPVSKDIPLVKKVTE